MLHEVHITLYLLDIGGILVTELIVDDYSIVAISYYAVRTVFYYLSILELHYIALVEYRPFVGEPRRYCLVTKLML